MSRSTKSTKAAKPTPDYDTSFAISARGLTKAFGRRKALDNVSFDLPQSAFLSIFGHNGAGKTTLLRALSTLSPVTDGSAGVLGYDLREEAEDIRRRIGLISHNSMLYNDLTAEENLLFYARMYGISDPQKRALELLRAVELDHRRMDVVRTFSRGMTQRLAIARALICDPELIFLDEPYSGLDPHAVEVFDGLIAGVREGRTVVMVSHDLDKGFSMCTHVLMLQRGKVELFAPRSELDFEEFSRRYHASVGMGVA